MVDACDSQLHQDYTIVTRKLDPSVSGSELQLVAFGLGLKGYLFCSLRKSKNKSREIATGAFLKNFRIIQSSLSAQVSS